MEQVTYGRGLLVEFWIRINAFSVQSPAMEVFDVVVAVELVWAIYFSPRNWDVLWKKMKNDFLFKMIGK